MNQHRVCKYKCFIGLCPNPFYHNNLYCSSFIPTLSEWYYCLFGNSVIEPLRFQCYFIRQTRRSRISRCEASYHCEAISLAKCIWRIKLRDFLMRSLATADTFLLWTNKLYNGIKVFFNRKKSHCEEWGDEAIRNPPTKRERIASASLAINGGGPIVRLVEGFSLAMTKI